MGIASLLRIKAFKFETIGDSILTVYAFGMFSSLLAYQIGSFLLLRAWFDRIRTQEFTDKFGTLSEGLNYREKSAMSYPPVFMLRRFIYALTIVLLSDQTFFQIIILVFKSSMIMAFQG